MADAKGFTLNANATVRVKLTAAGRAALRKAHRERWGETLAYHEPKEDAEGYSNWQVWTLMADLGSCISPGMADPLFEKWDIDIPLSALPSEAQALRDRVANAEKERAYAVEWANRSLDSVKAVMWRYEDALKKIANHATGGVGCNPEGFVQIAHAALTEPTDEP